LTNIPIWTLETNTGVRASTGVRKRVEIAVSYTKLQMKRGLAVISIPQPDIDLRTAASIEIRDNPEGGNIAHLAEAGTTR
jgi:hypothetical protein